MDAYKYLHLISPTGHTCIRMHVVLDFHGSNTNGGHSKTKSKQKYTANDKSTGKDHM